MVKVTNVDEKGRSVTLPSLVEASLPLAERMLVIAQVEQASGLTRKDIYKRIQRGEFPRQVLLKSKPNAKKYKALWVGAEILAWREELIAANRAVATGEPAPLPSRLAPAARAKAQATAMQTISDRKSATAPTQGTRTPGTRHRPAKGKQHAPDDETAPA
jgi:predicted DNA-binding transcriptional regulator AlpA